MKTKTLIAALAALLMTPSIYSDDNTSLVLNDNGTIAATSATVAGLRPQTNATPTRAVPLPKRTFGYMDQLLAAKADGQTGALTLDAGCGVETYQDGSFSDVTNEQHPIAYDANGKEIDESLYTDTSTNIPTSLTRKREILAIAAAKNDTASKKEGGLAQGASSAEG